MKVQKMSVGIPSFALGTMILIQILKIAMLHVVLDWQKFYKTVLKRHFSLFGISIFFWSLFENKLENGTSER
jgi:hypothetical protein